MVHSTFEEALKFLIQQKEKFLKPRNFVSIRVRESTLEKYRIFGNPGDDWDVILNKVLNLISINIPITWEDPCIGPPNAPVTIVEFSDFECVRCREVLPALRQVLETYRDRVKLVFKSFPRALKHPAAKMAHEAALCAHEQGKFWEYHDALFENQKNLSRATLRKIAGEVGLDVKRFEVCLEAGINTSKVFQGMKEGFDAGVSRVPTFFINGKKLEGNLSFSEFKKVIEEELRR